KRADAETKRSDGYATAFATLALCRGSRAGARRDEVRRALGWLAGHQEENGSWVGRSVNKADAENQELMTDAATAHAALSVARCAKWEGNRQDARAAGGKRGSWVCNPPLLPGVPGVLAVHSPGGSLIAGRAAPGRATPSRCGRAAGNAR